MSCYHDSADLKLIAQLKQLAPTEFQGFLELDKIVGRDGAIPRKYRELMALAVACTTQCPYCLDVHTTPPRRRERRARRSPRPRSSQRRYAQGPPSRMGLSR